MPIIFFGTTTGQRSNATEYRNFCLGVPQRGVSYQLVYYPHTVYEFVGENEGAQLENFKRYCAHIDKGSKVLLSIPVSRNRSYNFFIQLLDIVQANYFQYNIDTNFIFCLFPVKTVPQMYIDNPHKVSDFQYTISFITRELLEIKAELFGPKYTVRIMKYSDLGPPPSAQKPEEEPMVALLLSALGIWILPIVLAWFVLLVFSIKRAWRQLLPNQSLKLTEPAVDDSPRVAGRT